MNTGPQQLLRGARFLKGRAEQSVEGRDMLWRTIGQPTVALAPDVFSGVEVRRVGRERLDVKPGMSPDELLEFTPAMNRPPIPEQDHRKTGAGLNSVAYPEDSWLAHLVTCWMEAVTT